MSKTSKIVVVVLFLITVALTGAAIFVSQKLGEDTAIDPSFSEAGDPGWGMHGVHGRYGDWCGSDGNCYVPQDSETTCGNNAGDQEGRVYECDQYSITLHPTSGAPICLVGPTSTFGKGETRNCIQIANASCKFVQLDVHCGGGDMSAVTCYPTNCSTPPPPTATPVDETPPPPPGDSCPFVPVNTQFRIQGWGGDWWGDESNVSHYFETHPDISSYVLDLNCFANNGGALVAPADFKLIRQDTGAVVAVDDDKDGQIRNVNINLEGSTVRYMASCSAVDYPDDPTCANSEGFTSPATTIVVTETPTPTIPGETPIPTTEPLCGNGQCNNGEACDGETQCTGAGILSEGECRPSGTPDQCTYCGDGVVQAGEECDDGNANDADGCNNDCRLIAVIPSPTPPPNCGDNICNPGESCDGTAQCTGGGQFTVGECRVNCTYCGDGVVQAGEQCDDGNMNDFDGCNNNCMVPAPTPTPIPPIPPRICGDGILSPGEECESAIYNSCGPGGQCNPVTCLCNPVLPGLCGSACNSDMDCPSDNTCYGGVCRLDICVPGIPAVLSTPISGVVSNSLICTSNGCDVVQCGTECGAGGLCPTGLACSEDNICIIPYCIGNYCKDVCKLPATALIGESIDIYILSILLIILGLVAYRTDFGIKLLGVAENIDNTKVGSTLFKVTGVKSIEGMFKHIQRKFNSRHYKKSTRKKFEDKFEE